MHTDPQPCQELAFEPPLTLCFLELTALPKEGSSANDWLIFIKCFVD
jgi:hypothetical protein